MNIIPPAQYAPKVSPARQQTRRLDNATNQSRKFARSERRISPERRLHAPIRNAVIEMRDSEDRRKNNRIFVTT